MADERPRLAIVGASARAAAFSALRGGFEVVTADLFADADLAAVCPATRIADYPNGLISWLAATPCEAWLYTGALENHSQLVEQLASVRPLWGNNGDGLRRVRDPLTLQAACRASNLLFPETRVASSGLPYDGSWLCKTYGGASGSGVWRLDGDAAQSRAEREQAVYQRMTPGQPAATAFLVGKRVAEPLGVTLQLIGGDERHAWRYNGSIGPIAVSSPCEAALERIAVMLGREFGLRGLVGVDLILDGDEAWVVEVNPRYTASMEIVERATGESLIAAHAAACRNGAPDRLSISRGADRIYGKQIVYATEQGRVPPSFATWASGLAPVGGVPAIADVPRAGQEIDAGQPIATVFAIAESVEECRQKLATAEVALRGRVGGYA